MFFVKSQIKFHKSQIKFHKQLMKLQEQSLYATLKTAFNIKKLQPSIQQFNKMPLQSQLIIIAPVSAVCKPIFLLSCYYQIRLIITGDDSPASPR